MLPGSSFSPWTAPSYLLAGSVPLLMLGWGLARVTSHIEPFSTIRDSEAFQHAVCIWSPVIMAIYGTPRAFKRCVVRFRYIASLARRRQALTESLCVALGTLSLVTRGRALDGLDGTHLDLDERFQQALKSLVQADGSAVSPHGTESSLVLRAAREATHRHADSFPDDWPPTDHCVRLFLELWGTERVN